MSARRRCRDVFTRAIVTGSLKRGRLVDVKLRNIVQHEETVLAQLDKLGHGQRRSPASLVDVPANDMRGRNFAKPIDHLRFADVTGVDNHV